jgi:hypothetical protein
MAHWKRLTDLDNRKVDVNLENAAYMIEYDDQTAIYFAAGESDNFLVIKVKETPTEIHQGHRVTSL